MASLQIFRKLTPIGLNSPARKTILGNLRDISVFSVGYKKCVRQIFAATNTSRRQIGKFANWKRQNILVGRPAVLSKRAGIMVHGTTNDSQLGSAARYSSFNHNMSTTSREIKVIPSVSDLRVVRQDSLFKGRAVGLVPTMGALHTGHIQLAKMAAMECEEVYVSIYVNPTQFGVNEDLSSYPRTFEKDLEALMQLNADIDKEKKTSRKFKGKVTTIFNPSTDEMYPVGLELGSHITMNPALTQVLEGKSRPNFFQGVSTVVTKLLNIVQPTRAYFGQKDIQQLVVVQRMINEFHLPVELRCISTERHNDGLAMSSRNVYLGDRRRKVAVVLKQVLSGGVERFGQGDRSRKQILDKAIQESQELRNHQMSLPPQERALFEIDYLSLADPIYLKEIETVDEQVGAILSGAMIMQPLESPRQDERLGLGQDAGRVRLIDNFLLGNARYLGTKESHLMFEGRMN